ncbi:hypothetical protein [Mangrovihabitans endophyticus]|nr:hypothetical protein [Mangrovihabitans endophyticus]
MTKSDREIMEILESLRVRTAPRPKLIDAFLPKVEELVDISKAKIRADKVVIDWKAGHTPDRHSIMSRAFPFLGVGVPVKQAGPRPRASVDQCRWCGAVA